MSQLVNLTNSTIVVYSGDGRRRLFELPTEPPAVAVRFTPEAAGLEKDDETGQTVPVVRHRFELVDPLPDPEDGVVYVAGWAVLQALADSGVSRPDVVAPDTGRDSAVRDAGGRIVGVRRFRVATGSGA